MLLIWSSNNWLPPEEVLYKTETDMEVWGVFATLRNEGGWL
jgi:hypothetical protein